MICVRDGVKLMLSFLHAIRNLCRIPRMNINHTYIVVALDPSPLSWQAYQLNIPCISVVPEVHLSQTQDPNP